MVTTTIHEAVRRALDPFGMTGQNTSFKKPDAIEFIDRLESMGYTVVSIENTKWLLNQLHDKGITYSGDHDDCPIDVPHGHPGEISESELRVLDGNR